MLSYLTTGVLALMQSQSIVDPQIHSFEFEAAVSSNAPISLGADGGACLFRRKNPPSTLHISFHRYPTAQAIRREFILRKRLVSAGELPSGSLTGMPVGDQSFICIAKGMRTITAMQGLTMVSAGFRSGLRFREFNGHDIESHAGFVEGRARYLFARLQGHDSTPLATGSYGGSSGVLRRRTAHGRTCIPLAVWSQRNGYSVDWDRRLTHLDLAKGSETVTLAPMCREIRVNGNPRACDTSLFFEDDRWWVDPEALDQRL